MRSLLIPLIAAASLAAPAAATAAATPPAVPGEVIVRYEDGTTRAERAATQRATGTGDPEPTGAQSRVLEIEDGESVAETVAELERRDDVEYAAPNVIARASAFIPNDPGRGGAGNWQALQWNFLSDAGVNAPQAWDNARNAGAPGARGVLIAVLDTGVAYADRGRFRRSPDFETTRFASGYDFVAEDRYPNDQNGHGTFVAGLIAASTDNAKGLTGLAYNARIVPVRVLNSRGEGTAADIEQGIRYAVRRGVRVINLSLEFGTAVRAAEIPGIIRAIRDAHAAGVTLVAAAGNEAGRTTAYPARASQVLGVGATTDSRCLADYSNGGTGLDLVAPGGGPDAPFEDEPNCRAFTSEGRDIFHLTFKGSTVRRFGIQLERGTSMSAPHVTATAALVIATGVIGRRPTPGELERRLESTARDLGPPGDDARYGAGLLDAAAATAPASR